MLPNLLWLGRRCAAEQSGAGRGPVNGLRVLVLIIAWLSGPGYTPHWSAATFASILSKEDLLLLLPKLPPDKHPHLWWVHPLVEIICLKG